MKNMEKRLTKNKLFVRKNIQNDEKKVEKILGFCLDQEIQHIYGIEYYNIRLILI